MVDFRIANEKALLSAIKRSKNSIAMLIGAPLSAPHTPSEKGVPTVAGMLKIIEEHLNLDIELYNEYKNEIADKYSNDNIRYQKSFEFLADYIDPETPNTIIQKAVLQAANIKINGVNFSDSRVLKSIQSNTSIWHLPPATEALAKLLKNHSQFEGPVLTTNFDPLLSIALEKLDYEPNRTVLHGDGSLEQLQSSRINIVHMHGFWISTDTMHTSSQLKSNRPKLKSSLSRVLKDKTLLVIGYGGWDDVFMHALQEVMDDPSANLDVIWALFESDKRIIQEKYEALIHKVEPAIARNRFRFYGGVNCHEFLPKLCSEMLKDNTDKPIAEKKITLPIQSAEQENSLSFGIQDTCTPVWRIHAEPAHKHIRDVERADIFEALGASSTVNLVSDWGLGKDEFISTLVDDINSPIYSASIYRIDLSEVLSKDQLLEKIESDYGFGLQSFITGMSDGKCLLVLDNYNSSLTRPDFKELWFAISWLTNLIIEFNSECKIIVCSKAKLMNDISSVRLTKLEEFDIRSYITSHSKIQEKPEAGLIESLSELSRGIPSFLDKYISELEFFSIDDIYDSHFSPETYKHDQDSIYPSELKKRVNDLLSSPEEHSKRSYELLKTLSILELGDSFTNIKRSNSSFNFRPSHLKELYSLELVETLSVNKSFLKTNNSIGDDKLHCLPPIVRDYVYSQLATEEIYEIIKRLSDIHLGKNWRSGSLNLCKVTKDLLTENSKSIGSTHIVIIQLLRCPIELNNSKGIDSALRICESYCIYLSGKHRHREIVKFIEQVKVIARESDKVSFPLLLDIYEGESRRMISDYDKAEAALLAAYDKLKLQKSPENKALKKVLSSLALFYERKDDREKAYKFAKELLEIDNNNVGARYIVAITSRHVKIKELKSLEQDFRNHNETITANNLALSICDKENTSQAKLKWLVKVLNGRGDQYNKFRAITRKGVILIGDKKSLEFSPQEINLLHTCYAYSFSQKMMTLFDLSHKVLWEYYLQKNNYVVLLQLFRQSSLFWRIYEKSNKEQLYSVQILNFINNLLPESVDLSKHRYVTLRVNQLSDI